jgi:hypothetical protein
MDGILLGLLSFGYRAQQWIERCGHWISAAVLSVAREKFFSSVALSHQEDRAMKINSMKRSGQRGAYKPSAEEIERACAKIQEKWSARQRSKRSGRNTESNWTPPRVDWASISEAMSDIQNEPPGAGAWLDSTR